MDSDRLGKVDRRLAERYGSYAGYIGGSDPVDEETFGNDPADELDRLLDMVTVPERVAYCYESYFSDADHLAAYLLGESMLFGWPVSTLPTCLERDRLAHELHVRYYPATPEMKPRYVP